MSSPSNKRPKRAASAPEERTLARVVERPTYVPTQAFQDAVLAELCAMSALYEQSHIAPTFVLRVEADRMFHDALNALYQRELIDVGRTLNDRWINPKQDAANP